MYKHKIVIIGGGFAGLYAARCLKKADAEITLIDRRNYHLFQPLLYQVATGTLSPADIASPLRDILKKQKNTRVIQALVTDIDPDKKEVTLHNKTKIEFDSLIVATGSQHHYFGNDEWEKIAPGLKSIDDATSQRARILAAFEKAEQETDSIEQAKLLRFIIVGGGPTGVEMAGAIGEMTRSTLRDNFRNFNPRDTKIFLVEGAERILMAYPNELSANATRALEKLGVDVRLNTHVTDIKNGNVVLKKGDAIEQIETENVIWAAGVKASNLAKILKQKANAELDRQDRVIVNKHCALPEHNNIFVIGDMARFEQNGEPIPGVAPAAMQMGRYVARLLIDRLNGKKAAPFRYWDKGSLAVIGRAAAVAKISGMKFSGYPAWLLWLFIHIMYIVEFENRVLIFMQWAFSYFTKRRGARLITGKIEDEVSTSK